MPSAWGPQTCPLLAHASTDALAPVLGHPLGSPRRSRGRAPLATESLAEGSVRVSRRPTCGAQRAVRFAERQLHVVRRYWVWEIVSLFSSRGSVPSIGLLAAGTGPLGAGRG